MKTNNEAIDKVNRKIVYYIRIDQPSVDEEGRITYHKIPKTTVTLLQDIDGNFSRGVSMCSPLDIFNKKQGRAISFNRALAGLNLQKKIGPINREDVFIENGMDYKIEFQPVLTEYEKQLLKGPKEI